MIKYVSIGQRRLLDTEVANFSKVWRRVGIAVNFTALIRAVGARDQLKL